MHCAKFLYDELIENEFFKTTEKNSTLTSFRFYLLFVLITKYHFLNKTFINSDNCFKI